MKDDTEILIAMTQNMASYGVHLARAMNGDVIERDEVVLCNPHVTSEWKNTVVPLRTLTHDEADDLAGLARQFYGRSDAWVVKSFLDQPHLPSAGFEKYWSSNPAMTLAPDAFVDAPSIDGLELEEIHDEQGIRLFDHLWGEAYGESFPANPQPGEFLDERVLAPFHRLWVGRFEGSPIATGAVFEANGVSMVKNVTVSPRARGRGIGSAMSAFVVKASNMIPVLDADNDAPKLYKRLGFHEIGNLKYWKLSAV